jgi:hypothetical protein
VPIPFFKQTIAVLAYGSDTNGVLGAIEVASPRVPSRLFTSINVRTRRSMSWRVHTASSSATT